VRDWSQKSFLHHTTIREVDEVASSGQESKRNELDVYDGDNWLIGISVVLKNTAGRAMCGHGL